MAPERQQHHVVLFPFMAKGHTIPLLDFSKALSHKGLRVTILATPANSPFILSSISAHQNISVAEIEFPTVDDLPKGCESTDRLPSMDLYVPFLRATLRLRRPFEHFLSRLSDLDDLPLCVVSDFFLGWTLPVCREFGIPRLVFHGMGAFSISVCKSTIAHAPHTQVSSRWDSFSIPGLPQRVQFTISDLPTEVRDFDPSKDPLSGFLMEIGESDLDSYGVLVNTSIELERDFVGPLESFYRSGARAKAWCVGPALLMCNEDNIQEHDNCNERPRCMEWLDEHAEGSVVYVSFGTQTHVSEAQLDEIAWGLEMSGCSYLWVVRSKTWSLPKGLEDRIKGRGLMIREWAPQRSILAHPATGGFLSHCGWNSVLESLSMGVPLFCWPMIGEQCLNTKLVVEEFKAGARVVADDEADVVVGRAAISRGLMEFLGGETGMRVRERAQKLSSVMRKAVGEGGSSQRNLDRLINELIISRVHAK